MTKRRTGMSSLNEEAIRMTNEQLQDRELKVLTQTNIDWQALRPKVNDPETYDKLVAIVNEATDKNESLAQLKSRMEKLGKEGVKVAKEIIAILK